MPRMTIEYLRKLVGKAQPGRSLIPSEGDHYEPLCAIYSKSAAPIAAAALLSADVSLQGLTRLLLRQDLVDLHALSADESRLYLNLNRPDDFTSL